MFVNWGLEAQKWRLILRRSYHISFLKSLKAVFSGNATGMFTPNRLGAFIGRVIHLPKEHRAEGTITTWVGNAAQFVATLLFGTVGTFIYCSNDSFQWNFESEIILLKDTLFYLSLVITICALCGYFMSGIIINWISKWSFAKSRLEHLEKMNSFSKIQLAKYLGISVLRYLVFIIQFHFLFKAFNVTLDYNETFVYVGVLYFIISFLPTLFGKLGVRESILLILLAHLPYSELQIISVSFTLWLINTIFPALLGAIITTQIKKEE